MHGSGSLWNSIPVATASPAPSLQPVLKFEYSCVWYMIVMAENSSLFVEWGAGTKWISKLEVELGTQ
jgi:hypothetical protein